MMLNKIFYSIILSFGLAACANKATPQIAAAETTTETPVSTRPKYDANLLVGKWTCKAQFNENSALSADVIYHADGTSSSQGVIKMGLSDTVAWRFAVESKGTWRIDGEQYFEKYTEPSKVKTLLAESKSEQLALKAFEKSSPDVAKLKAELMKDLAKSDNEEAAANIVQLDDKTFIGELSVENENVKMICTR